MSWDLWHPFGFVCWRCSGFGVHIQNQELDPFWCFFHGFVFWWFRSQPRSSSPVTLGHSSRRGRRTGRDSRTASRKAARPPPDPAPPRGRIFYRKAQQKAVHTLDGWMTREREREREIYICIYTCKYTHRSIFRWWYL